MEKEDKPLENNKEGSSNSEESNFDSQVFLKIAEELKKDTENIGKKYSGDSSSSDSLNSSDVIENKIPVTFDKNKPQIKKPQKNQPTLLSNLKKRFTRKDVKHEKIIETKKIEKKEPVKKINKAKMVQPQVSIIKNFFSRRPNKQERIIIKEVPKLRRKINSLRHSFSSTAEELKNNLGAVNFHQDAEIEFLKKEAGDLNKLIPFLIERIDTIERYNKTIRSSAARRFSKLGGEIKKSQEPLRQIAEEEKFLETKIDNNTLRFNKRLLQELAESKRMIEEEKFELKNHLLNALAKSMEELNRKKEEADKKILSEIDNLRQKIDEGDRNVSESAISKIVQLRRKLNESKSELQEEINHELEDLKKTVERRVDRKIERKIDDSQHKMEEDFSKFRPQKEISESLPVRHIKEIKILPVFEGEEVPAIERVPRIKQIEVNSFNFADNFNPISKSVEPVPSKLLKSKRATKNEDIKIDDFSSLPEIKNLEIEIPLNFNQEIKNTPNFLSKNNNSPALRKLPKFEEKIKKPHFKEKMHYEIKEEINLIPKQKSIKPVKKKIPSTLYLEEPKVRDVSENLNEFKKVSKIGEQYFLKEIITKKENHKKLVENFDEDYEIMKKNLASVRSLLSKVKD